MKRMIPDSGRIQCAAHGIIPDISGRCDCRQNLVDSHLAAGSEAIVNLLKLKIQLEVAFAIMPMSSLLKMYIHIYVVEGI